MGFTSAIFGCWEYKLRIVWIQTMITPRKMFNPAMIFIEDHPGMKSKLRFFRQREGFLEGQSTMYRS